MSSLKKRHPCKKLCFWGAIGRAFKNVFVREAYVFQVLIFGPKVNILIALFSFKKYLLALFHVKQHRNFICEDGLILLHQFAVHVIERQDLAIG